MPNATNEVHPMVKKMEGWKERNEARINRAKEIYQNRKCEIVHVRETGCDDYEIRGMVTIRTFNNQNQARFLTAPVSRLNDAKGSEFEGWKVLLFVAETACDDRHYSEVGEDGIKDARNNIQQFLQR